MSTLKKVTTITEYRNYAGQLISVTYTNEKGKKHRADGPAYIYYSSNGNVQEESYYLNGISHRTYGPAYIYYYPNCNLRSEVYFLEGKRVTKEEFLKRNSYPCANKVVECEGKKVPTSACRIT